ncbi:MAG: c-type cytochrome [Acidobacteria bacterium]|nr:c-type cytochrome [Acidobacteriota bacterium]
MNRFRIIAVTGAFAVFTACAPAPQEAKKEAAPYKAPSVPGYSDMEIPADNPITKAKVDLGHMLYYDKRVSGDQSRSCYSCHVKEKGLTDGLAKAVGAYEAKLTRAAPTMWNVGYYKQLYWDGRAPSLERQVLGAMGGGNMGCTGKDGRPTVDECVARAAGVDGYKKAFEAAFGPGPITKENFAAALASFMRTIVSTDSAWFKFRGGDQAALSDGAKRGYQIFSEKAKCTNCHDGLLLTDQQFHNVGIGMDAPKPDMGRGAISKDEKESGAFKTPTLLDISKTAPYFHDGSAATLEQAVDVMVKGGKKNKWLDTTNLKAANLSNAEVADLVEFLKSLDVNYTIAEPALP